MRRLMLAWFIVCITATPIAFAHSHHASADSPGRSATAADAARRGYAKSGDHATAHGNHHALARDDRNRSVDSTGIEPARGRVPDEEELEVPEE